MNEQGDCKTGAAISASTVRVHTPWTAVFFISVRKAQSKEVRLDRASWLVCLLSPRLAWSRFLPSGFWGNCPNRTWASSRIMNIPAHLMLDSLCNIRH